MIDYFFFIPGFADQLAAHMIAEVKASGASQVEIDKETKEMAEFVRMYKNPLFVAMMTYAEILPVGLVVTVISSLILKRKAQPSDNNIKQTT